MKMNTNKQFTKAPRKEKKKRQGLPTKKQAKNSGGNQGVKEAEEGEKIMSACVFAAFTVLPFVQMETVSFCLCFAASAAILSQNSFCADVTSPACAAMPRS